MVEPQGRIPVLTHRDLHDQRGAEGVGDVAHLSLPALSDDASGRARLLAAAVDIVATQGAASLRVTDVVKRAGVSLGLIAHHFGGRHGLIAEAQVALFMGAVSEDLQAMETLLDISDDRTFLLEGFRRITLRLLDPDRISVRALRVSSLGSAHGTSELRERLRKAATGFLDRMERFVARLQVAGIIRRDRNSRAIATFVQAYGLGMVLADLDQQPPSREELAAVIDDLLEYIFLQAE